jgi:uncharacterized protein with FMN-binding domain
VGTVFFLCLAGAVVMVLANRTFRQIEARHAAMGNIPLASIPDGTYRGRCGLVPIYADLSVTVREHRIEKIS